MTKLLPRGARLRALAREKQQIRAALKVVEHTYREAENTAASLIAAPTIVAVDETGERWIYQRAVAIGLISKGTIKYHPKTDAFTVRRADAAAGALDPAIAVCDFCGEVPVTWLADAADFTFGPDNTDTSHGGWTACEACADAILHRDRKALFDRAVSKFKRNLPLKALPPVKREVARMHGGFWDHFTSIQPLPEAPT